MTDRPHSLPQLGSRTFLADGGLETTLIFHNGMELPYFAAFDLLRSKEGRTVLKDYYRPYIAVARSGGYGFILDSATWRASTDWAEKLGYSRHELALANRQSIEMLHELKREYASADFPMVVSGAIGPRGDGYAPELLMSPDEAEAYHAEQIGGFAQCGAEMVTAFTMTHTGEAIGIVRAALKASIPCAISFTVETDGRLPSGETLAGAIAAVDDATDAAAAYYWSTARIPPTSATSWQRWRRRCDGCAASGRTPRCAATRN